MGGRRFTTRRPRHALAALALVAALAAIAGCGGGGGGEETAPPETTAPAETAATAAETAAPAETGAAADTGAATTPSNYPVTDFVAYTGGTSGAADSSLDPVVIGWVNNEGGQVLVGPTATQGAEFAVKYVNEKLGGVDGHPVELRTCSIKNAEEEGQKCGQELLNDPDVKVILFGAVAVGATSLESVIAGTKPIVIGVSVNAADSTNPNTYILFGDQKPILWPWGTLARDVLQAKTAAVVYPETPGVAEGAEAIKDGLEAAGVKTTFVGYDPATTDLVGPLTAAGAQSADMIVPQSSPDDCVKFGKALQQLGLTENIVSNPLCLTPFVAEALGGDFPKWIYGIAQSTLDPDDAGVAAYKAALDEYGLGDQITDPWYAAAFAEVLTTVQWMNAVGFDNLTPEAIQEQALAFRGPLVIGPPDIECGRYPDIPASCNDNTVFFQYEGQGVFKNVAGWLRPPEALQPGG